MKTSLATEWKNARLLEGNIFEKELDLVTGGNIVNIEAKDGSDNTSLYNYNITLAAASAANTYTYDADGNLLSDGIRSYTWDCFSRLVSIAWGGGSNKTTRYLYNAQGQRCEQIDYTGSTETAHFYYLYDGIQLLARYTGDTSLSNIDRRYTVQGEQRKISNAWQSYYYNRDHLGSIREVLHADGSLAARYDYTPYGQETLH